MTVPSQLSRAGEVLTSDTIAWAGIGLLLLGTPFLHLLCSRCAVNPDPFSYGESAKAVLAGRRLYTEFYFDKGPLVPLLYAVPGLLAPRSYAAICFFGGVWISLTALVSAIAFHRRPWIALTCVSFATLAPLTYYDFQWCSTEHLANLFVAINFIIALRIATSHTTGWEAFTAGMLTVLLFNLRQPTVLSGFVPLVATLTARVSPPVRQRLIGEACLGSVAGLSCSIAAAVSVTDLGSYLNALFFYPVRYAAAAEDDLFGQLAWFCMTSGLGPLLALACWLAWQKGSRMVVVAGLAYCLAQAFVPRKPYPHYLVSTFPFVAVMCGYGLSVRLPRRLRAEVLIAIGTLTGLAALAACNVLQALADPNMERFRRIAVAVDTLADDDATLAVSGPIPTNAIQFLARTPPANFFWQLAELSDHRLSLLPAGMTLDRIVKSYIASPPTILVVYREYFGRCLVNGNQDYGMHELELIRQLLSRFDYQHAATVEDFVILRLQSPRPGL